MSATLTEVLSKLASNQNQSTNPTSKVTLDEATDFLIRNDWFGGGTAEITSNKEAVFKMVRPQETVSSSVDCHLTINNMSGQPLLALNQHDFTKPGVQSSRMNEKRGMTLSRFDLSSSSPDTIVPICMITRNYCKLTIHNRYEVELVGPTALNYDPANRPFSIDCKGHWPKSFTFNATHSGEQLANVKKTMANKWQLHVSAGEDILLFLGIACAIDFMSHESPQRTTTNVAIVAADWAGGMLRGAG